jgi:CRP-like cAMP-binding protein
VQIEPRGESINIRLFLASLPVFASFSGSELSEVEKCSTVVSLEPGVELFEGGGDVESVYAVVSGALEFRGSVRSESTPDRLVSGNLFVRAALGLCMPRSMKAVASERSHVLRVPVALMERLLFQRPAVRDALTSEAARHLVRMHLATIHMFTDLDDVLFSSVAERCDFLMFKRGQLIIQEGDNAECLYIVAFGTLEVFREQADGKRRTVEILHDGACVGEMALLLKEPRSVSVRARRDSLLVRVPAECFEHVLQKNGRLTLDLVRTLGKRLMQTTTTPDRAVALKTIAIVPFTEGPHFSGFCERLRDAFLETGKKIAFLRASDLEARSDEKPSILNTVDDRFRGWLADQESEHDFVLFQCERGNSGWTERCNRQADLVLIVCMPDRDELSEEMRSRIGSYQGSEAAVELVMLRSSTAPPKYTGAWLECGQFKAHHHIVWNDKQDCARLTRRVQGKSWGLVLGGGGARGLSHIGTIQALHENGMPIDWVAGTSMGAIIAAQVAMGLSVDEMIRVTKEAYSGSSFSTDYTFPFVSMRTGRSTVRTLQQLFGDQQIEDIPINYFCV